MSEGTEVTNMADALALAVAESGQASLDVAEPGVPPVEAEAVDDSEQASDVPQGQPAADTDGFSDEARELGDLLKDTVQESQNSSDSGTPVPGSDDFWNQNVEVKTVEGPQTVTMKEMRDGYLRQADYTQKTQAVADERRHLERAEGFLKMFEEDPAGFTRSLAVQAGLISEGDEPIREIPMVSIPTQDSLDELIKEQVEERYKNDPRAKDLDVRDAEVQITTEFARLEEKFDVPIGPEVRQSILQEAYQTGNPSLEGIFAGRLVLAQQKQSRAGSTSRATTSRPGSAPSSIDLDSESDKPPKDIKEAYQRAKVAAAQQ